MLKSIIGHTKNINILKKSYNIKFPQSWIFFGAKGVGKFLAARIFARWIINKQFTDFENNESKFISNIFEINTNDNLVSGIDDIREIMKEMVLTNLNEGEKIIIFDNFDYLNINSMNALLKNIEEPKEKIIIIIICHNIYKIPKTILSRCQKLYFNNLTKEEFSTFVSNNNYLEINNSHPNLFDLCDGRPGLLKFVDEINITETFNHIDKMMNEKELDYEKLFKISEKYKKDPYIIDYFIKYYLYNITKKNLLKNLDDLKYFKDVINFFSILNHQIKFDLNFDIKNYITSLFLGFIKVIRN